VEDCDRLRNRRTNRQQQTTSAHPLQHHAGRLAVQFGARAGAPTGVEACLAMPWGQTRKVVILGGGVVGTEADFL